MPGSVPTLDAAAALANDGDRILVDAGDWDLGFVGLSGSLEIVGAGSAQTTIHATSGQSLFIVPAGSTLV
ncbi:MAG: hypothetical protein KDA28_02915, partial [Phycisphaerales bacterium]|nr:hypothetical protein [Phycisphaerales bacterium]